MLSFEDEENGKVDDWAVQRCLAALSVIFGAVIKLVKESELIEQGWLQGRVKSFAYRRQKLIL